MKITFQIETTFFSGAIDLSKNIRIHLLENVLVTRQIISQFLVVVLVLLQEIGDDFQHLRLQDFFIIQVQEFFFLANMPVALRRRALFPEHVDHLMLVLIGQFSVQREWIQVFCHEHVNIKIKMLVEIIFLVDTYIGNVRQEISRFNSCGCVSFSYRF